MGQPKLLLKWGNWTVMDQLLWAWTSSAVDHIVVVVREEDADLQDACQRWPVHLVKTASDPPDMKASIRIGREFIEEHWRPADDDQCFVAPADLPGLHPSVIDRLIDGDTDASAVKVPHFGDRQGHPIVLPWGVTSQICLLPEDQGIKQVVEQNTTQVVSFAADEYFRDVDTPEEYEKLAEQWSRRKE